jgi:dienelactone hydrolase
MLWHVDRSAKMTKTEQVTFPANGGSGQGYLAIPDGPGPHRAVVVIQEWWGLNEHIKDVARRFAEAGYLALAPDLYHGAVADEPDDARRLVMDLQIPEAAKEMAGAAAYLAGREDVAPKQVGAIGFCLGGSLALLLAGSSPQIGAVASFYGGRQFTKEDLSPITAPVLAIFGEADEAFRLSATLRSIASSTRWACRTRSMSTPAHHTRFSTTRARTPIAPQPRRTPG